MTNRPLRLWPGIVAAVLLVVTRWILPAVAPGFQIFDVGADVIAVAGGLLFGLAIVAWWLFLSRAPRFDRVLALVLMTVAAVALQPLTHVSIRNGQMGMMFYIYAIPSTLTLALVVWAMASRGLSQKLQRVTMVAAILAGCGVWTLARTDGLLGGAAQLAWRWTPTAEELLLAQADGLPVAASAPPIAGAGVESAPLPTMAATPPAVPPISEPAPAPAEWPGFRGPDRDGAVRGVRINTDWSASPPVEMWRRPVGPGWSSFAVSGDLFYTQEQRGEEEVVACYKVSSGEPVWGHRDPVRFWESNGGAGPRGTPTVHNGRVYALGATGIINALEARTGAVVWSRNAAADTGRELPGWGFTSSPLVIDDVVVVATSGTLAGYDVATGTLRWTGPSLLGSYSSPHRVTIDGVTQVLFLSGSGAASVAPGDGSVLWQHEWPDGGTTIVQPAVIAGGDILINTASAMGGLGLRRLRVTRGSLWTVEERWTSNGLKPYFNDFVVHNGHAIGFDGSILASINLEDGKRDWKGGRYGAGQMLLLPDQDLLVVISEEGDLALVSALPDKYSEIAKVPALDGKTWNHPVLVGDTLLVRNGQEMAAFRLPPPGR